jgi:hypothetical protein
VVSADRVVPGADGGPDVPVRVFRRATPVADRVPAYVSFHGGGYIVGSYDMDSARHHSLVAEHGCVTNSQPRESQNRISRTVNGWATRLRTVDAWATLAAAVAGAAIAILGQYVAARGQMRTRGGELLLEHCAVLVAMNEDFRNRLWEERVLGQQGRLDGWDLAGARLATARLRILCPDESVLTALVDMNSAAKDLGAYWRRGNADAAEVDLRYEQLKQAIESFADASTRLIRPRLSGL